MDASRKDSCPETRGENRRVRQWVRTRRQEVRSRISAWLTRYRGTLEPRRPAFASEPESILVCRVNKRLGNTLFITPLINALAKNFPRASIDLLVLNPDHQCLLAGLPRVREVIHVPHGPVRVAAFLFRFRRRRYDLAIDPSINATTNRLAIILCRARYRLGFAGPEQWVPLTHAAAIPPDERHQARQTLHLLRGGVPGIEKTVPDRMMVRPRQAARAAAERVFAGAFQPGRGPVVGFFTEATGRKQLPADWWRRWAAAIRSMDETLELMQILPPGSPSPLCRGISNACFEDLERLAALFGLLDVFVAADCGPMHLAAAAGTPTIGLFQATSPDDYAPLGRDCLALGADQLAAEAVAERALRHLRSLEIVPARREVSINHQISSVRPRSDWL